MERQRERETLLRTREQEALREANTERLRSELQDWRTAKNARACAETLRKTAPSTDREGQIIEWADWVERWADHVDPTTDPIRIEGVLKELPDRARLQLSHASL
jgi:hypothetical protein